jgi:hypothetical protein
MYSRWYDQARHWIDADRHEGNGGDDDDNNDDDDNDGNDIDHNNEEYNSKVMTIECTSILNLSALLNHIC